MDARAARRLLLVQAVEQGPEAPWTPADAAWATAEARRIEGGSSSDERLLARRAECASRRLTERMPVLARGLDAVELPGWAFAVALGAAFAIGVALDGFAGHARINVLALPLLGLLAWNVVVYLSLACASLSASIGARRADAGVRRRGLRAAAARAVVAITDRLSSARRDGPALARFGLAWAEAARPLHVARAAAVLHGMAAAIALGLVAGLYLRGLAFEYRAGWESTFLDAPRVHALISLLLGPAAALIGDPLPDAARLAALRFPASAGENAAPWIHRIALTVGLVVVLPRLVLAGWAARRARRMEGALPIDLSAPYFERLRRELRGELLALRVQPYERPAAAARPEALARWLEAALGGAVLLSTAPSAAYGDDAPAAPAELLLFDAGATPEAEVHGDYLRRMPGRVAAALIDETDLRRRLAGPDAEARLDQRRRAWRALLDAAGVTAVFVDLDAAPRPDAAEAVTAALRRAESIQA